MRFKNNDERKIMQQPDGTFKLLTEEQALEQIGLGNGGKILREGQEAKGTDKAGRKGTCIIESVGRQFVWARSLPGCRWAGEIGAEITLESCQFIIKSKSKNGKTVLLQGVPA